jgi:hypothetical protein
LIDLVKEKIRERDRRKYDDVSFIQKNKILKVIFDIQCSTSRVYRVIQCQEKEVTQLMSSLSDGWKFEQVIYCYFEFHSTNLF